MMREIEIERQFEIKIESIKPNRGVYLLKTNKGNKCLKKINYGIQKLVFVYAAKEHLINNGFNSLDRHCLNSEGNPYAIVNEDVYTLSDWINGRECDFKNKDEIYDATKKLAQLHISSKGYEPPENSKLKTDLGRWPYLMEKRIKSLDKMRDMCRKQSNKKDFDFNYLKFMEFNKALGKRALRVLSTSEYANLCAIAEDERSFCHHDFTYNNIIIDENENYNVIDFDYCKREIRAFDISNFMIKVLKRVQWDIDYCKLILNAYNEVSQLSEGEYRVIFAFLLFPQRFWRLSNRYYYNEVNWSEGTFNNKIAELIQEKDAYMNFIESFRQEFNQEE